MTDKSQHPKQQNDDIDLKRMSLNFLGHWHWLATGIIIALLAGWLVNRYTKPVYESTSSILVKEEGKGSPLSYSGSISGEALEGFGIMSGNHNLYNQQEIIRSWPVIRKAVEALNLEVSYHREGHIEVREMYTDSPFRVKWEKEHPQVTGLDFFISIGHDGNLSIRAEGEDIRPHDYISGHNIGDPGPLSVHLESRAGNTIESEHYAFSIILAPGFGPGEAGDYVCRFHTIDELEAYYKERLEVESDERSSILRLKVSDAHPDKGKDFLNALMQVYEDDNLKQKNNYANRTISFIGSQLNLISDSLSISEEEMLTFRAANRVINLSAQSEILLNRLTELDNQQALLESQIKYYHYLQDYIDRNQELESIVAPSAMGVDDPLLSRLIEELNTLILEKARLGKVKESPRLNQLNAQIETLKAAMLDNISDIRERGDVRLQELNKRIAETEQTVNSLPATERDFVNIQRRYQLNSETYTFLLQKLTEAQIAKASNVSDSRVVEGARMTGQVAPMKSRNYMIALVLGLFIPGLLLILRDYFSTKIYTEEDVEHLTSLPILGHVFMNRDRDYGETPVLDRPASPASGRPVDHLRG